MRPRARSSQSQPGFFELCVRSLLHSTCPCLLHEVTCKPISRDTHPSFLILPATNYNSYGLILRY